MALDYSQHYKKNFSNAPGQITPGPVVYGQDLYLSKVSCIILVSCKNEDDSIKNEGAREVATFSHYKSIYVFFSRRSRAANSAALSPIWQNFELIGDILCVSVFCNDEEDPINTEGAKVFTTLYINLFRRSRADNSGVGGGIRSKFELIQIFMH